MAHRLPPLPFSRTDLEPVISAETIDLHYGKHHKGYVDKLNELVRDTPFASMPLTEIVQTSNNEIFNNAAQAWNHDFYWRSLKPGGAPPREGCLEAIRRRFSSVETFHDKLAEIASHHFGSGWAWLVVDEEGGLAIETTSNADTPIRHGRTPLLTIDLWEHAYYLDYKNERASYLSSIFPILNWDFAEVRYKATMLSATG